MPHQSRVLRTIVLAVLGGVVGALLAVPPAVAQDESTLHGTTYVPDDLDRSNLDIVVRAYQLDPDSGWQSVGETDVYPETRHGRNLLRYGFASTDLAPGTYRLGWHDKSGLLADRFWTPGDAAVGSASIETSRDVVLPLTDPAARSRNVHMSIRPELEQASGTSIEGFYAVDSEVRVQPGVWSTSPDSVTYVWRVAGKEVGRGVTHTPTGVGHRAPLVLDAYAYAAGRAIGHDRIDLGRPAPATPTGLHLVGRSATTAAFEWDPVESDEIVEATVKRGSGLVNQTLLRGHAFTLTEGLAPNTAYTVGIRRLSDGGSPSSLSTSIAFTTGPMGAPTAVKAARKTTSSITLQWKRPAGAHIYRIVYWRGSDRKVVTTIIQAFQHKVTKLKRNSTYSFYVVAVSRDGRSVAKSATVKVKTAK